MWRWEMVWDVLVSRIHMAARHQHVSMNFLRRECPGLEKTLKLNSSKARKFSGSALEFLNEHRLQLLHDQFRQSQISFTIGYGLGVVQQAGYSGQAQPQVDMIHVVEDPMRFHESNSRAHPNHYSALRKLGPTIMRYVQESGAGVYFNPYVKMGDSKGNTTVVKYGVVSREAAFLDLTRWDSLYVAGRLHKPVKYIYEQDDLLRTANQYNLQSVFSLATLLLAKKTTVSLTQIFEMIAAVSYMGDPRMLVGGENPNKVKNIVSRQHSLFEQLYAPSLRQAQENGTLRRSGGSYTLNLNPGSISELLNGFPSNFKRRLLLSYKQKYAKEFLQDKSVGRFLGDKVGVDKNVTENALDSIENESPFLLAVSSDKYLRWTLRNTVLGIIAYPALVQSCKGIFTAGITKSAKYAWEKKMKGMKK